MRLLVITAVEAEAKAIGPIDEVLVHAGGIGRTNAAAATTMMLLQRGPFDAVLSVGVAGALPGGGLSVGEFVVASRCVYAEEGLITPGGFRNMEAVGFSLGDFTGNEVPVDAEMLEILGEGARTGAIATVATCSGTDAAARVVGQRTAAIAEAMEGAAVVHAARRLGARGIEMRAISNTTGDRDAQVWDLPRGLDALGRGVRAAVERLRRNGSLLFSH